MSTITTEDINKLRKLTGAGMMDCKKALQEAEGDFEKAIDELRKKGQKIAANRSDREAKEGVVLAKVNADNTKAYLISLNCETDFVAKNEGFTALAQSILDVAVSSNISTIEELLKLHVNGLSIADKLIEQTGVIGEKIEVSFFEIITAPYVSFYIHTGNKLASILGFNHSLTDAQIGKNIAMQVAAMAPVAVDETGVSADMLARELEIGKEQAKQEGKPENMIQKIAEGKVVKFLKENTLLTQSYIMDNTKTVGQYLKEQNKDLTVTNLVRFSL